MTIVGLLLEVTFVVITFAGKSDRPLLNVDGDQMLSGPWTGFTQLSTLNEGPPKRYTLSEERLTEVQATSRTDSLCQKILKHNAKRHWAMKETEA